MAKTLTQKINTQITNKDIHVKFILKINNVDYSDYLITWNIDSSKEFGSMSATFMLKNDAGIFGEGGAYKINLRDTIEFSEYFGTDTTEFKKFYGYVDQRSIAKSAEERTITLVCLDYIATLQNLDINYTAEGSKVLVENETLTPNYLASPNDNLAQLFDFANNSLAEDPRPILNIINKNTNEGDPAYDGMDVYYDVGQLKLGYPLNARYNYNLIAQSYYYYTHGLYIEDIIESVLTLVDGYGKYLFGETTAQAVIDNHLTETFLSVEGTSTDYMIPNYTASTVTIETTLTANVALGATSINVITTSGFPTSGQGKLNGNIFTWTSKSATTLDGVPASGTYSLKAHKSGDYVEYEKEYSIGQLWYLKYSNLVTDLTSSDFTIPGGTFNYMDKRFGRIILETAISTSAIVKCNTNYSFKTLQASGIELNKITFKTREVENRYDALKKLLTYCPPNYLVRTKGSSKIWSEYLYQKTVEDYTLQLVTSATYMEDEDVYTRVVFFAKNKNPTNLMFNTGVDFITSGESYKGIATNSELTALREDGNYYVYGSSLSGVGKITANTIKPIVYVNAVPINNTSALIAGQQVGIETTTRTDTSTSGGGK